MTPLRPIADVDEGIAPRPGHGVWGTINGVPVTDEVIERFVANAEAGLGGLCCDTTRRGGRKCGL